jgi:arylsulfatase A-like enzyme
VPLVLYGPLTLGADAAGERTTPGSHLDIAPTLLGLAAERGFNYYSFGNDLLAENPRPLATGRGLVMTATELFPLDNAADRGAQTWCRAWLGTAWWRLMRGPELPPSAD